MRRRAAIGLAVLLLAVAAGCGADAPPSGAGGVSTAPPEPPTTTDADTEAERSLAELADARARWAALGLERYRVEVKKTCFCPVEYLGPFVVTVVDGEATRVELGEGAAAGEPPPDVLEQDLTVEQIFARIEEALTQGGTADVDYDAETGAPLRAALDPIPDAIDDETLVEMELLPEDR